MTYLAATLPVMSLAEDSVGRFASAANRYRYEVGLAEKAVALRPGRIAASFTGDRILRIDGQPISGFAELSGFFDAADGWVRTHGNYPHHRERLLRALELPESADRDAVVARVRSLAAADVEARANDVGAIAVRVRTESEWSTSAQGIAAADGPIVGFDVRSDWVRAAPDADATSTRPLTGVRVLDLTRVIAGPTATRALGLLGADVLRIDPPHLPEIEAQHVENGQGKRSALLDLQTDSEAFRGLLSKADVLVSGYRPGAVERFIDVEALPAGIVWARVCAWSERGPWAKRRGFDSIVQAASGISLIEGGATPGALPAQALDHATGYYLAAGIVEALAARVADRFGTTVTASLARTAAWLLSAPGRTPDHAALTQTGPDCAVTRGTLVTARPALADYDDYSFPARPWGRDEPGWMVACGNG